MSRNSTTRCAGAYDNRNIGCLETMCTTARMSHCLSICWACMPYLLS